MKALFVFIISLAIAIEIVGVQIAYYNLQKLSLSHAVGEFNVFRDKMRGLLDKMMRDYSSAFVTVVVQ